MAWPTSDVNTSNLNSSSDSPASARADLLDLAMAVNAIIEHRGEIPGTIKAYAGMTVPSGYLACNGSAVSRSTYKYLFEEITKTVSGTITSGSDTITSVNTDMTQYLPIGCPVSGPGIPSGTIVLDRSATTIKLSKLATLTSSGASIVLAPYGVGDGSTTFNVPLTSGRTLVGTSGANNNSTVVELEKTDCSTTAGSTAITLGLPSFVVGVGMRVAGPGIPYGTKVASISGTSVTLSSNATDTATGVTLRFFVTDSRRIGDLSGEAWHYLSTAEMPPHTHNGNGMTNRATTSGGSDQVLIKNATENALAPAVNATGDGLAHNNIQPSTVVRYMIKT